MGAISNKTNYPSKSPVSEDDYLIGTDSSDSSTKTFTVSDVLALFTANNIASLPTVTSRGQSDYLSISQSGTAKSITVEDFVAEPVVNAGNVSGTITVDLSQGHWYIFTLIGNVSVTLENEQAGARYLFWVYSNGNYAVSSMSLASGGNIYSQGGSLPNPANNSWNLYEGFVINGGMILTELDNFSAI
jgi:hypothetical protein